MAGEGAGHEFFGPSNATDLWHVKKVEAPEHGALDRETGRAGSARPVLVAHPGENVLDLFGGSGSTLIAAEQTGRRAYLMELDPLYCDVIVSRWTKFTGKEAVRVSAEGQESVHPSCGG